MKYYYALSDSFTGDNPKDYCSGFANTSIPIAFESKKERDNWLKNTKLLKAKTISRREAEKLVKFEIAEHYGYRVFEKVKIAKIYGKDSIYEHVILTSK